MLWLKNLHLYRLSPNHGLSIEQLQTQLSAKPFQPCGSQDLSNQGWVPPASHTPDLYTVAHDGVVLVALKTEEKLLPASVVRQQVEDRVQEIEAAEHRKVGRKEMRDLRDDVTMQLLPRAFVRQRVLRAMIDLNLNLVWVESASEGKAEDFLSHLRETLGNLPAHLLQTAVTPQTAMTTWLEQGAPEGFTLDADCELRSPGDESAVIRISRHNLDCDEVRQHLDNGKVVTRLGLSWNDHLSFLLTEKLEIKRLAMLDVLEDNLEEAGAEDQAALFDASFILLCGELRHLTTDLLQACGGELNPQAPI